MHMLDLERAARGSSPDLEVLTSPPFQIIIPRLLTPLESGDRRIKPSLIHGDLRYGNAATKITTNEPAVFDVVTCYGHNECMTFVEAFVGGYEH